MKKMKLVADPENVDGMQSQSFRWVRDGREVAEITLYEDGLVEFHDSVGRDASIEGIGTKRQQVVMGQPSATLFDIG